ncbi:MAG TPA: methyltransferase domain-containing protein [Thermoanaerobaculia bacterium]
MTDGTNNQKPTTNNRLRLHIGCGPIRMDGWINIDVAPYEGVDRVLDVTEGLPFEDASFVYAEHFIEHLPYPAALAFMRECRRALGDDGVLRLSTPNLDWVWASHYKKVLTKEEEVLACFAINRAFHGWGHQFLWNEGTLRASLLDAGFASVVRREYGVSEHPELHGIERHEWQADFEGLSHILIVEASGRGGEPPTFLEEPREMFLRDVAAK